MCNRTKPRISLISRIRLITPIRVISEIRGSSEIPRPEARPAARKTEPNKLLRATDRFSRGLGRDMALRSIFHSRNLSHNLIYGKLDENRSLNLPPENLADPRTVAIFSFYYPFIPRCDVHQKIRGERSGCSGRTADVFLRTVMIRLDRLSHGAIAGSVISNGPQVVKGTLPRLSRRHRPVTFWWFEKLLKRRPYPMGLFRCARF